MSRKSSALVSRLLPTRARIALGLYDPRGSRGYRHAGDSIIVDVATREDLRALWNAVQKAVPRWDVERSAKREGASGRPSVGIT